MKKLIRRVRKTRSARLAQSAQHAVTAASSVAQNRICNYADNYYGDQVCLLNGGSVR